MTASIGKAGLSLGQPALYEIVVQGSVSKELADRLGGLRLRSDAAVHGVLETSLSGRLADQAQLLGVLNALYEMRLPILRVEVQRIG